MMLTIAMFHPHTLRKTHICARTQAHAHHLFLTIRLLNGLQHGIQLIVLNVAHHLLTLRGSLQTDP